MAKEINKNDKNKISDTVIKGLIFLGKSIYSQWKMLFSISTIFLVVVFFLALITLGLDSFGSGNHFEGGGLTNEASGHLTFSDSIWWVFITISTVGYGDIYPATTWMRIWAIFISLIGIAFVAIYTAVIVNGFTTQFKLINNKNLEVEIFNDEEEIKKLKIENSKLKKENKNLHENKK